MNAPCPTPHKAGYFKLSTALLAADRLAHKFDAAPYSCECGRYHLTSTTPVHLARKRKRKKRREQS